ncbi:hypothetical protein BP6252_04709 [Coleophoma cylindrospora]|uniref:Zn(2)-C6 fungal-type domain-containing protein n=1 Tax=Coleophoma cylindrospora TaxID=1849047 RepID=A0A3D8S1U7_9HELO|nr:hypothetical protein BP6252_04709 [Coleophoma cylindrospora]
MGAPLRDKSDAGQKRKAHKKSRSGCRNCKLRRVKCDESKPHCRKCNSFGVSCNYDPKAADLEISARGTATAKLQKLGESVLSENQLVTRHLEAPGRTIRMSIFSDSVARELDGPSVDRFGRFQEGTVMTLGAPAISSIYQREITRLSCFHPYLMHVVQTITAMQDRYASSNPGRQSATEAYHWHRATSLFNHKLSTKFRPSDRDSLWATAALLGVVSTAMFDAQTPEEAWPLKPASNTDLMWTKICGEFRPRCAARVGLGPNSLSLLHTLRPQQD